MNTKQLLRMTRHLALGISLMSAAAFADSPSTWNGDWSGNLKTTGRLGTTPLDLDCESSIRIDVTNATLTMTYLKDECRVLTPLRTTPLYSPSNSSVYQIEGNDLTFLGTRVGTLDEKTLRLDFQALIEEGQKITQTFQKLDNGKMRVTEDIALNVVYDGAPMRWEMKTAGELQLPH